MNLPLIYLSPCSVHLKIHVPKIIKKHTHVQTIYKHLKVPVIEESASDEYKEGSEKYVQIDPKVTLSALGATNNFGGGGVTGNELRSMSWSPMYSYQKAREMDEVYSSQQSQPQPLKMRKRFPKALKVVHQYEEYPRPSQKTHRVVKHVIPTYEIHEEAGDAYGHSSEEEYSENRPRKSYLKTQSSPTLKFIPVSEVSKYLPTIPFAKLASAQSQYKPVWTPKDFMGGNNKDHQRPGRSSRYEGKVVRVITSDGMGEDYSSPMLPAGTTLERRFVIHN